MRWLFDVALVGGIFQMVFVGGFSQGWLYIIGYNGVSIVRWRLKLVQKSVFGENIKGERGLSPHFVNCSIDLESLPIA